MAFEIALLLVEEGACSLVVRALTDKGRNIFWAAIQRGTGRGRLTFLEETIAHPGVRGDTGESSKGSC